MTHALASVRPALTGGTRPPKNLTRRQKAAIIVRLLLHHGVQLSLDELPEALQVDLAHEMSTIRAVDRETMEMVVQEFTEEVNNLGVSFPGGLEGTLNMLDGALSPENLQRLRRHTGVVVRGDPWEMIAALETAELATILERESLEVAAVILSKLPVAKSAGVLALLPGDLARQITYTVSTTHSVDPDTVRMIGQAVASQIGHVPPKAFPEGPVKKLGAILDITRTDTRDGVLEGLDERDAELGAKVRRAIFTFENIAERIDGRDVPKIVRAVDQFLLVTALAGAAGRYDDVVTFILENMSQRMANQLREEIDDAGQIKPSEADKAMTEIVTAIRDLEQAGEISFIDPED